MARKLAPIFAVLALVMLLIKVAGSAHGPHSSRPRQQQPHRLPLRRSPPRRMPHAYRPTRA